MTHTRQSDDRLPDTIASGFALEIVCTPPFMVEGMHPTVYAIDAEEGDICADRDSDPGLGVGNA